MKNDFNAQRRLLKQMAEGGPGSGRRPGIGPKQGGSLKRAWKSNINQSSDIKIARLFTALSKRADSKFKNAKTTQGRNALAGVAVVAKHASRIIRANKFPKRYASMEAQAQRRLLKRMAEGGPGSGPRPGKSFGAGYKTGREYRLSTQAHINSVQKYGVKKAGARLKTAARLRKEKNTIAYSKSLYHPWG